jgi:hypothetical protein
MRNEYIILAGQRTRRRPLLDLGIDGKIQLNYVLQKQDLRVQIEDVAHGTVQWPTPVNGFLRSRDFLHHLRNSDDLRCVYEVHHTIVVHKTSPTDWVGTRVANLINIQAIVGPNSELV